RYDLFALDATLYHSLVGRPPFEDKDLNELMDAIVAGKIEPPHALVPNMPEELDLVVHQLLAPDLRYRYQRAEQAKDDLERVLRDKRTLAPCVTTQTQPERRWPLLPAKRFTFERDATYKIMLDDTTVSQQHAQLRREATGYVLRDLK